MKVTILFRAKPSANFCDRISWRICTFDGCSKYVICITFDYLYEYVFTSFFFFLALLFSSASNSVRSRRSIS
jgi:hypothetical protein